MNQVISITNRQKVLRGSIIPTQTCLYTILYNQRQTKRAFSDFQQLRSRLLLKYGHKSILIPQLSQSFSLFGWWYDSEQQNLDLRQQVLLTFMKRLQSVKELWNDSQTINFMDPSVEYEQASLSQYIKDGIGSITSLQLSKVKNFGMAYLKLKFQDDLSFQQISTYQEAIKPFSAFQSKSEEGIKRILQSFVEVSQVDPSQYVSSIRKKLQSAKQLATKLKVAIKKILLDLYQIKNQKQNCVWLRHLNELQTKPQGNQEIKHRLQTRLHILKQLILNFEDQLAAFKRSANELIHCIHLQLYEAF